MTVPYIGGCNLVRKPPGDNRVLISQDIFPANGNSPNWTRNTLIKEGLFSSWNMMDRLYSDCRHARPVYKYIDLSDNNYPTQNSFL